MTPETAARRLSAALGRHIKAESVSVVYDPGDHGDELDLVELELADGSFWTLWPGNRCNGWPTSDTKGPLHFYRNGKRFDGPEGWNSKRSPEVD